MVSSCPLFTTAAPSPPFLSGPVRAFTSFPPPNPFPSFPLLVSSARLAAYLRLSFNSNAVTPFPSFFSSWFRLGADHGDRQHNRQRGSVGPREAAAVSGTRLGYNLRLER